MKQSNFYLTRMFLVRWLIANALAWPVGFMVAVLLSETIVNFFHPKETNLLVGLGMGLSVGFAQWFVAKKTLRRHMLWIAAPALAVGIPFGVLTFLGEGGTRMPALFGTDWLFDGLLLFLAGALAGALQTGILKRYYTHSLAWIPTSGVAWAVSLSMQAILLPGVLMGLITGLSFGLFFKARNAAY